MTHKRRLVRGRLRQVRHHRRERVASRAVRLLVAAEQRPNRCVRVLRLAGEEVEVAVADEAGLVLGVLLPDGELLDIWADVLAR